MFLSELITELSKLMTFEGDVSVKIYAYNGRNVEESYVCQVHYVDENDEIYYPEENGEIPDYLNKCIIIYS